MRTQDTSKMIQNSEEAQKLVSADSSLVSGVFASATYHELADVPVKQVDLIEQLQENLHQLETLQSRLRFMTAEIRYLLKV